MASGNSLEDPSQSAELDGTVIGHRDVVLIASIAHQADVRAALALRFVAKHAKRTPAILAR
jgi:hypothetical protein